MPTLTIVPQFVSQTATGGRATWADTANLNVYNDGNSASATSSSLNQQCQDITLSVAAQPLLAGATIQGVRFRVHTARTSTNNPYFAYYYGSIAAPNLIRDYFEASSVLALREAGSLSTIAPGMAGATWTNGFEVVATCQCYANPTTALIDGLQFEVEYTPAPQSGLTPAAMLLLDE